MKAKLRIMAIFAMLLANIPMTAWAFSDTNDNAVQALSEYGIISGYQDNTFKPQNKITRAEFATIISKATLIDANQPDILQGIFTDGDTHWAKKYIYIVKDLEIASGKSVNKFAPDDNITYEQAIKMIVTAIGYDQEGKAAGGYPDGYIKVASDLGITSGIVFNAKNNATRLHVAQMVNNALNCQIYFLYKEAGIVDRVLSDETLDSLHKQKLIPVDSPQTNQEFMQPEIQAPEGEVG